MKPQRPRYIRRSATIVACGALLVMSGVTAPASATTLSSPHSSVSDDNVVFSPPEWACRIVPRLCP